MGFVKLITTRRMALSSAFTILSFVFWSCGKSELNYGGPDHRQTNSVENPNPNLNFNTAGSVKVRYGTLELVPGLIAKSGFASYAIYEDGGITYDGYVSFMGYESRDYYDQYSYFKTYSYFLNQFGKLLSQSFHGGTKVAPAAILSSSYKSNGAGVIEKEIQLKVTDSNATLRTVSMEFLSAAHRPYIEYGSPTDHDAKGTIQIDTSSDIIDIVDAEFQGRVFDQTVSLRVKKAKAPQAATSP